jgi:hypothetical protein
MAATKERLTFSVDASIKDGLERQIPKNQRSAFAERALEDALERLAREKAIEALDALTPAPNPQGVRSEDVLRDLRKEQGDHLSGNTSGQ